MFRYKHIQDAGLDCPSVLMEIISPINDTLRVSVDAVLDTASAISCLPNEKIRQLGNDGLVYDYVQVLGATGNLVRAKRVLIDMQILNCSFRSFPVVVIPRSYAIIGRDIMNSYRINLNGPRRLWSIHPKCAATRTVEG